MAEQDIESILIDLGYDLDDRGDYWQCNALYRDGDNRTALQIYKDTGVWKDYVEETGFLPFKALVEKSLDGDKELVTKTLKNISTTDSQKIKPKAYEQDELYGEDELKKLLPHYKFYEGRGINKELLKELRGGLSTQGQMYQRFVFPIYNSNGLIIGFAGRDMTEKEGRPKWKHIGKKTKWCYPFYHPSFYNPANWNDKNVVLVESIGDFLSIKQNTNHNTLVTFGLDISPTLISCLVEINPKKIILSSNNDSSSQENRGLNASIKNYLKLLSFFDSNKIKICLPTKNDFGDMSAEDYKSWEKKLERILLKNQKEDIINTTNKLFKNKKISKNLYSKLNLLNE